MKSYDWQLTHPLDAIVFDCDSTLSEIEGIDVIAEQNGFAQQVKDLTNKAMNETGVTPDLYQQRMLLVKPSRHKLIELGQEYFLRRAPDIISVIDVFKALHKNLFVLSAGLNPSVKIFAALLNIPEENVFAVDVTFDEQGNYVDYDHTSLLTTHNGKRAIIEKLKEQHPRILSIGDGMNDYEAHAIVDRFVGYGGVAPREKIKELCEVYIKSPSLLPLLPLSLTPYECQKLITNNQQQLQKGFEYIDEGFVDIKLAAGKIS